jgi:hypothetical protein
VALLIAAGNEHSDIVEHISTLISYIYLPISGLAAQRASECRLDGPAMPAFLWDDPRRSLRRSSPGLLRHRLCDRLSRGLDLDRIVAGEGRASESRT